MGRLRPAPYLDTRSWQILIPAGIKMLMRPLLVVLETEEIVTYSYLAVK